MEVFRSEAMPVCHSCIPLNIMYLEDFVKEKKHILHLGLISVRERWKRNLHGISRDYVGF